MRQTKNQVNRVVGANGAIWFVTHNRPDFLTKFSSLRHFLAGVLLLFVSGLFAQAQPISIFEHMTQEEPLEITLQTNLGQLLAGAETEPEYQSAVLSFAPAYSATQVYNIKLKARGKFRLQVCDFPPLKLNFSKGELEKRDLVPAFDKLKLVTHCLNDSREGQEKLLREYLAYRLFQEVSPYSFRVQLVRIKYVDDSGQLDGFERFGFLIENTRELMHRLQGEEQEEGHYSPLVAFDEEATQVHAMFQYFIGNADYSVPVLRNVKLLQRNLDSQLIPIGYDFDFSGFVNAPYAIPSNHLGQLAVKQRIFLGTHASDASLQRTIELFFQKKKALISIIDDAKLLNTQIRRELRDYLLTYYEQMEMIRQGGYQGVYRHLRQEHPSAVPDGGVAADYGVSNADR